MGHGNRGTHEDFMGQHCTAIISNTGKKTRQAVNCVQGASIPVYLWGNLENRGNCVTKRSSGCFHRGDFCAVAREGIDAPDYICSCLLPSIVLVLLFLPLHNCLLLRKKLVRTCDGEETTRNEILSCAIQRIKCPAKRLGREILLQYVMIVV